MLPPSNTAVQNYTHIETMIFNMGLFKTQEGFGFERVYFCSLQYAAKIVDTRDQSITWKNYDGSWDEPPSHYYYYYFMFFLWTLIFWCICCVYLLSNGDYFLIIFCFKDFVKLIHTFQFFSCPRSRSTPNGAIYGRRMPIGNARCWQSGLHYERIYAICGIRQSLRWQTKRRR